MEKIGQFMENAGKGVPNLGLTRSKSYIYYILMWELEEILQNHPFFRRVFVKKSFFLKLF